jgi:hypothetical protein
MLGCTAVCYGRDTTALAEHVRTCPHRLAVLCYGVTVKDLPAHLAECAVCGDGRMRLLLQERIEAQQCVLSLEYTLCQRDDELQALFERYAECRATMASQRVSAAASSD